MRNIIKEKISKKKGWAKRIKEETSVGYLSPLMFALFWGINPHKLYTWIEDNKNILIELGVYYNNMKDVKNGVLNIDALEKYCKYTDKIIDELVDELSQR
jgi:hypothetical protein